MNPAPCESRSMPAPTRQSPARQSRTGDSGVNNSVTQTRKPRGQGSGMWRSACSRAPCDNGRERCRTTCRHPPRFVQRDGFSSRPTAGPPGGLGSAAPHFEQTAAPSPLSVPQTGHVPRTRRGIGFPSHFPHETQTAHMAYLLLFSPSLRARRRKASRRTAT